MSGAARSPRDGLPYYCASCGLGPSEMAACEDGPCVLESPERAQERAALARRVPQDITTDQDGQCAAEARRRLEQALQLIEAAQGQVGDAVRILSTLRHGNAAWQLSSKLYDRIHADWYRVERLRGETRLQLDPDTRAAFLALRAHQNNAGRST